MIIAAPAVAPAPVVVEEPPQILRAGAETHALAWSWEAPWLGRIWQLTDLRSPVLKLRGATGTGQVDPAHRWLEHGNLPGAQWNGTTVGRGQVFLPLQVTGADTVDFLAEHGAFLDGFTDPTREGLLRVTRPDGQWRQIACRYDSGADFPVVLDPVKQARAVYGITWATGSPFWEGEPVTDTFGEVTAQPFHPGPPWTLLPNRSLTDAEVTNPGNVPATAVWRVWAPFTGFTIGYGTQLISMTLTKPTAGQWVEIDTRPGVLTIVDELGVDRWDALTAVDFGDGLPPGRVPLTTTVTGSGAGTRVDLTFTPRYRSGW